MQNKLRITVLCENTVGPVSGTLGEHGFAALLEGDGLSILFDTGMGETLLRNALRMNRDLHRVEQVVLSHGHCDHTGGLLPLLRNCGGKEVYAHPAVFSRRYRVKDNGESIPIGMPCDEAFLRGMKARFNLDHRFREIAPGVFLTGEVPRKTSFEKGDRGMFLDPEGREVDPLADDQSLVIKTSKGLVLLLGCCHAGLVNTIEYVREKTGEERVYAVIGGTHLSFSSHEQTEATVRALRSFGIGKISASHCTGFAASVRLQREFPGEFHPANVGYMLETG
jgi:7,8-dihydropterin-6-yl-methyl-4-(beta-D-ribofuranosyl)aminobenzene 5'-phosphate synthase